jgi:hypothetical protein
MRYALMFAFTVVALTMGALATFDHISLSAPPAPQVDSTQTPVADTLPTPGVSTPTAPTAADYARFADVDRVWRETFARQYTVAELRSRGDGRRTGRDSVQDRAFEFVKTGQRGRAIGELERWVSAHPSDRALLLSLARLLAEDGRSEDAVVRYRQLLALRRQ